jgi:hypothetical protein
MSTEHRGHRGGGDATCDANAEAPETEEAMALRPSDERHQKHGAETGDDAEHGASCEGQPRRRGDGRSVKRARKEVREPICTFALDSHHERVVMRNARRAYD